MNKSDILPKAVDLCEKYRRQGFACSESVIRALSDTFCIAYSEDFIKEISVFAGGATEDGRCGVLEAGLAALANMYVQGRIERKLALEELSVLMHEKFEHKYNGYLCSDIFYPLYREHQKKKLAEEEFSCAFYDGISIIAETLYDNLERKKKDEKKMD